MLWNLKSVQTDKIALQKEMNGMVERLRPGSDVTIDIGDPDDLTEIIINWLIVMAIYFFCSQGLKTIFGLLTPN